MDRRLEVDAPAQLLSRTHWHHPAPINATDRLDACVQDVLDYLDRTDPPAPTKRPDPLAG